MRFEKIDEPVVAVEPAAVSPMPMVEPETIVSFHGVSKFFGNNAANKEVSFSIYKNEIHALLGENGAGKSTIMSILFGLYSRDKGDIVVKQNVVNYRSAKDANADGIAMLPQHFKLIDNMTVLENVILGKEKRVGFVLNNAASRTRLLKIMNDYKLQLDPNALVDTLSVSEKQRVELLKILWLDTEIVILDEPTSILTPIEVENFLNLVVSFKQQGKTVIIITHKLDEVKRVADRFTVLRRGSVIGTDVVANVSESAMAKMMVGRSIDLRLSSIPRDRTPMDREVLQVSKMFLKQRVLNKKLADINLSVRAGEILGIAAVEGNGQSELFKIIGGMMSPDAGEVYINSQRVTDWSIKKRYATRKLPAEEINALRAQADSLRVLLKDAERQEAATGEIYTKKEGSQSSTLRRQISHFKLLAKRKLGYLAHIPEDRQEHGLVLDFTCAENAVMQDVDNYSHLGFFIRRDAIAKLDYLIRNYDVRGVENANTPARALSGGNQQKLILGREIERQASVLLAFGPTRGLDVGSIRRIYRQIINQRNNGAAVLFYSGELDEIMDISDRIAIMYKGSIIGIFDARSISRDEVGLAMFTGVMPEKTTPRQPIFYTGEEEQAESDPYSDTMRFVHENDSDFTSEAAVETNETSDDIGSEAPVPASLFPSSTDQFEAVAEPVLSADNAAPQAVEHVDQQPEVQPVQPAPIVLPLDPTPPNELIVLDKSAVTRPTTYVATKRRWKKPLAKKAKPFKKVAKPKAKPKTRVRPKAKRASKQIFIVKGEALTMDKTRANRKLAKKYIVLEPMVADRKKASRTKPSANKTKKRSPSVKPAAKKTAAKKLQRLAPVKKKTLAKKKPAKGKAPKKTVKKARGR